MKIMKLVEYKHLLVNLKTDKQWKKLWKGIKEKDKKTSRRNKKTKT